jgi:hypothetical protein
MVVAQDTIQPPQGPVAFLFGAGASIDAGIPPSAGITEIMTSHARYCPSTEGVTLENLVRYLQLRIADHLGLRTEDINFEYILGALSEIITRSDSPLLPILGDVDTIIQRIGAKLSLEHAEDTLFALRRELLTIRKPVNYLHDLADFITM